MSQNQQCLRFFVPDPMESSQHSAKLLEKQQGKWKESGEGKDENTWSSLGVRFPE